MTKVYLETGRKRVVFACALEWPGWCRKGTDEGQALAALAAYAPRYALVAKKAGLKFPASATDFDVVERVPGSASTDFGVPGSVVEFDREPLKAAEAKRLAALVEASWTVFDGVVAGAPAELHKGPRGGGRDRDKIVEHVLGAEATAYSGKIGLRLRQPAIDDAAAVSVHRAAILAALRTATHAQLTKEDPGWPPRYAARRIAWHILDHAWEIEDRKF